MENSLPDVGYSLGNAPTHDAQPYEEHLMLDVECLGTRPGAPLGALGAVIFQPDTGKIVDTFYEKIDFETSVKAGGTLDAATVKWWLKQATEAQLQMVGSVKEGTAIAIDDAFLRFGEFVQRHQKSPRSGIKHWANGANFDPGILEEAYYRMDKQSPLVFWKSLDVRTIVEMGRQFGIDPKGELTQLGSPHKALDDCMLQVNYVSQIWQRILPPHPRQYAWPQRNNR
jgi:hypothetical protein